MGGVWVVEDRYARARDMEHLEVQTAGAINTLQMRLDSKILEDEIRVRRSRIAEAKIKTGRENCGTLQAACQQWLLEIEDLHAKLRAK